MLTIGRESIALLAKIELQRLCELYGIGIEIQQLVLQDVNPPDPVKPAFNEVNQAIQEKERAINEAWADYNQAVPRAKGEAEQAVRSAEGYALERVNNAEGDAERFEALYEEYRKAPAVTRKRMYLETMATMLPKLGKKVVIDESAQGHPAVARSSTATRKEVQAMKPRPDRRRVVFFGFILLLAFGLHRSETEQVLITQFGKPVGGLVTDAGLHLKLPFVQDRAPLRQALARVRRRRQRDPHQGQEVHLGRHLRALAHRRPAALLPGGAATSGARRAGSTTSSTARPATPSPRST